MEQLALQSDCEAMLAEARGTLEARDKQLESALRARDTHLRLVESRQQLEQEAQQEAQLEEREAAREVVQLRSSAASAAEEAARQRRVAEEAEAALKRARGALQTERWRRLAQKQQAQPFVQTAAPGCKAAFGASLSAAASETALSASASWVPVLDFHTDRPLSATDEAVVARVIASQVTPTCHTTYTTTRRQSRAWAEGAIED